MNIESTSASKLGFLTKQSTKARFRKELEFRVCGNNSLYPPAATSIVHNTFAIEPSVTDDRALHYRRRLRRRVQPNTNSEPTRTLMTITARRHRRRIALAIVAKGRGRRSLGFWVWKFEHNLPVLSLTLFVASSLQAHEFRISLCQHLAR